MAFRLLPLAISLLVTITSCKARHTNTDSEEKFLGFGKKSGKQIREGFQNAKRLEPLNSIITNTSKWDCKFEEYPEMYDKHVFDPWEARISIDGAKVTRELYQNNRIMTFNGREERETASYLMPAGKYELMTIFDWKMNSVPRPFHEIKYENTKAFNTFRYTQIGNNKYELYIERLNMGPNLRRSNDVAPLSDIVHLEFGNILYIVGYEYCTQK